MNVRHDLLVARGLLEFSIVHTHKYLNQCWSVRRQLLLMPHLDFPSVRLGADL